MVAFTSCLVTAAFITGGLVLGSELVIKKDYLRDLNKLPLPKTGSAYAAPQPGKCNNFGVRINGGVPAFIMQHHTVSNYNQTISSFTQITKENGRYLPGVSSHFVINTDGSIQQTIPFDNRAFHAGTGRLSRKSKFITLATSNLAKSNKTFNYDILQNGKGDMNSWTIGIENVNSGDEPFTKEQIKANIFLCEYLCNKFPTLDSRLVIAHSDWTYRKIDPSPYFPWSEFANASQTYSGQVTRNFGVYSRRGLVLKKNPKIIISFDNKKTSNVPRKKIIQCQELLRAYGFDIPEVETGNVSKNTKGAIFAAHIHFQGPKIINDPVLRKAWHNLVNNIQTEVSYNKLTIFDENLFLILSDSVDQL